jgi:glutathione S-transferase
MKLYTSPLSPYSARVRASIYHKGLEVEMVKPSSIGGMTSPAFLGVTPIGKIPALVLDDGTLIAESDAIVEYLEDTVPTPSLRPKDPRMRARARMLSRIVELYVMGAVNDLSTMMPIAANRRPLPRDDKVMGMHLPQLNKALDNVETFLDGTSRYAIGAELSTADATLVAFLPFVRAVETYLEQDGLIERRSKLSAFVSRLSETPVLQRIFGEVSDAMQARREEIRAKFGSA